MKSTTIFASTLVAASQLFGVYAVSPDKVINIPSRIVAREDKATQTPKTEPVPGSITSQGCWSSKGNFTEMELKASTVSSGSCRVECEKEDFPVMALSGQQCLCGNVYPEKGKETKDSNCNYGCPAYPLEACGGLGNPGYVSVFNLGTEVNIGNYVEETDDEDEDDDKKGSETSASSSAAGPTSTAPTDSPEETSVESSAPEDDGDKKDSGSGVNVAGVVAGCVVGVLAVAGGAGAAWFFMRRRRNTEIEEEHRRNAAVNAFISGSKPPGSSGSISMTDSRLDPVMGHRRLSNGSIDDNQDYSRKILRVS